MATKVRTVQVIVRTSQPNVFAQTDKLSVTAYYLEGGAAVLRLEDGTVTRVDNAVGFYLGGRAAM